MYVPKHCAETRSAVLHEFIRSHPFGILVTMASSGLEASHIPFVLKAEPAPHGTLQGHLARGNAQWKRFVPDMDALVIFNGPDSYITPSWYPTKQATGKVVPTWNYVVVHAYGTIRVKQEADWLQTHVEELTNQHERDQDAPWYVADAPAHYTAKLLKGIVGVEIEISRLEGEWKLGQNRSEEDQQGMVAGLKRSRNSSAQSMARFLNVQELP